MTTIKDRTGEVRVNQYEEIIKIEKYINNKEIYVSFDGVGYIQTEYKNFKNLVVTNPYRKTSCGVGYLGEGKYNGLFQRKNAKEHNVALRVWSGMLRRCYDEDNISSSPTYVDCVVSDDWHNFQNFAEWYYENYYEVENQRMHVDKDILIKGNKVYSPETCMIVPNHINCLFIKVENRRGDLPIGVSYNNQSKKYQVVFRKDSKLHCFGSNFKTPEEAFLVYKKEKEKHIKEIADRYKSQIPQKLYDVLYAYEVEITD